MRFAPVPEGFPLRTSLDTRPVSYAVCFESSEKVAVSVLAAFWLIVGVGCGWGLGTWLSGSLGFAQELAAPGAALAIALPLSAWLGRAINDRFLTLEITLGDDQVEVVERDLVRSSRFIAQYAELRGVMLLQLGTHEIGQRKRPIASVVLVCTNSRRLVPVVIDEATHVGKKTVERIAADLDLPALDAAHAGLDAAPSERDIVINCQQAFKVRALHALLVAAALAACAWAGYELAVPPTDTAALVLAPILAMFALLMHIYAMRYVTAMTLDGDAMLVTTAAPFANRHRIARERLGRRRLNEGQWAEPGAHHVHAPWIALHVAGMLLPLIVDVQAEHVDLKRLL